MFSTLNLCYSTLAEPLRFSEMHCLRSYIVLYSLLYSRTISSYWHQGNPTILSFLIMCINAAGAERSSSEIGRFQYDGKPSMILNLTRNVQNPEYPQYVVVHEFGHALGLMHEHQRSGFLKEISPFLKRTPPAYTEFLKQTQTGQGSIYDPESVMHYSYVTAHTYM